MKANEVDRYLNGLTEEDRHCLEELRITIHGIVPGAEECISYKIPAFRIDGAIVAGFAAFKTHLSYLPFSGSVLSTLHDDLGSRPRTKSSLHFTVDDPLPRDLVESLIRIRREEITRRGK